MPCGEGVPGLVHFEPGRFLFQSKEKNVPEWIKAIDQWIDTAETRRMTEMNEKFKDL